MGSLLIKESLSFDDVLLQPQYSECLPHEVSIETNLASLGLKLPLLSAAMDTVTEANAAIALAQLGALGVIHKNMSAEDQAEEVLKVKNFQHAVIHEPITAQPEQTTQEIIELSRYSGFTGFPVVDKNNVLVGMCTSRDIRYAVSDDALISEIMTSPALSLREGSTQVEAQEFFRKHKVEKLPLVDAEGRLKSLITSKDWRQKADFPNALQDENGNLICAAALGVGEKEAFQRAAQLVEAGVDVLVLDSAHGHSHRVLESIVELKKLYPQKIIIGGNVATVQGAEALIKAGVDVVKIGMGPGSICTTRIVSGAGVPQFTAVQSICSELRPKYPKVSFVADGGIRFSGDVVKALAAGAHAVMLGSLLAGTDESPGDLFLFQGRRYKNYRGMGSLGAMKEGGKERYRQESVSDSKKLVPEGVEARVSYKGALHSVVYQLMGGLRSGMGYVGAKNIPELFEKAVFQKISNVALKESHVHDVSITAEAPNYSVQGKA